MNYALIVDGAVSNIIWLNQSNASEFPNAVRLGDRPVAIGDVYTDGRFYRDGDDVLTTAEQQENQITDLAAYAADLEYQNALNELGMEG